MAAENPFPRPLPDFTATPSMVDQCLENLTLFAPKVDAQHLADEGNRRLAVPLLRLVRGPSLGSCILRRCRP